MSDQISAWVEPSRREIRRAQRLAARRAAALDKMERRIRQKEARAELSDTYKLLKEEQRRLREARTIAKSEERALQKQMKEDRENAAMLGAALARAAAERQAIDDLLAGKQPESTAFAEYDAILTQVHAAKAKLESARAESKEIRRQTKLTRKRDRLARRAVDMLAEAEIDRAIIAADATEGQAHESLHGTAISAVSDVSPNSLLQKSVDSPTYAIADDGSDASLNAEMDSSSINPAVVSGLQASSSRTEIKQATDAEVENRPVAASLPDSPPDTILSPAAVDERDDHTEDRDVSGSTPALTDSVMNDAISHPMVETDTTDTNNSEGVYLTKDLRSASNDQDVLGTRAEDEHVPDAVQHGPRRFGWFGEVKVSHVAQQYVEPEISDVDGELAESTLKPQPLIDRLVSDGLRRKTTSPVDDTPEAEVTGQPKINEQSGPEAAPTDFEPELAATADRRSKRKERRETRRAARAERKAAKRTLKESAKAEQFQLKKERRESKEAHIAERNTARQLAAAEKQAARDAARAKKNAVRAEKFAAKEAINEQKQAAKEAALTAKAATRKEKHDAENAAAAEKKRDKEASRAGEDAILADKQADRVAARAERQAAIDAQTAEKEAIKAEKAKAKEAARTEKIAKRALAAEVKRSKNAEIGPPDTSRTSEMVASEENEASDGVNLMPVRDGQLSTSDAKQTKQEILRLRKERSVEEQRRRKAAKMLRKTIKAEQKEQNKLSGDQAESSEYDRSSSDADHSTAAGATGSGWADRRNNKKAARKAIKETKRVVKEERAAAARVAKDADIAAKAMARAKKQAEKDHARAEKTAASLLRRSEKVASRQRAREDKLARKADKKLARVVEDAGTTIDSDIAADVSVNQSQSLHMDTYDDTNSRLTTAEGIPSTVDQHHSDQDLATSASISVENDKDGESGWSVTADQPTRNVDIPATEVNVESPESSALTAKTSFDIDAAGGVTHVDSDTLSDHADFTGVDATRDGQAAKSKGSGLRRWMSWIVKKGEAEETQKHTKEQAAEERRANKEERLARKEAEREAEALRKQTERDEAFEQKQLRKLEKVRERGDRTLAKDDLKRADREERNSSRARAEEIRRNAKLRQEQEERERREERDQAKFDRNADNKRPSTTVSANHQGDDDLAEVADVTRSEQTEVAERTSFLSSLKARNEVRRRLRRQLLEAREDGSASSSEENDVLSKAERKLLREQLKEEQKRIAAARKGREDADRQERRDRRQSDKADRRAADAVTKAADAERDRLVRSFKNTRSEEKARKKEAAESLKAEQRRIKDLRKSEAAQKRADDRAAKQSIEQDKKYRKEVRRQQKKKVNQQRRLLREETKIARRARRIEMPEIAITRDEAALGPAYNWDAESGIYNAMGAGSDIDPSNFDLPEALPRR